MYRHAREWCITYARVSCPTCIFAYYRESALRFEYCEGIASEVPLLPKPVCDTMACKSIQRRQLYPRRGDACLVEVQSLNIRSYVIRQYGQKRNQQTGLHRLFLVLERVPGQRPFPEIANIPRPAQMDDWHLFERHESEMVRQKRGNKAFLVWKTAKAEERIDLEQWKRALELGAQLKLVRLGHGQGTALPGAESEDSTSAPSGVESDGLQTGT